MGALYIDRRGMELRLDGQCLALYEGGSRVRSVPLTLTDRVVIRGEAHLTSTLLAKLASEGVSLLVLGGRHSRPGATMLGRAHENVRIRIAHYRCFTDEAWRERWSRELVLVKIRSQVRSLDEALARRPAARHPLTKAMKTLTQLDARLREEGAALDRAALMGIEGAASSAYFSGLAALFPESLGFRVRRRRPPPDPVNACLSLGYTLLHFDAARAVHGAGLDPLLGLYHEPAWGRESLAADLIEPLRVHVDELVWELFRTRTLQAAHFSPCEGGVLLSKAGRRHFYAAYEQRAKGLRRLLRIRSAALVRTVLAADPTGPPTEGQETPGVASGDGDQGDETP